MLKIVVLQEGRLIHAGELGGFDPSLQRSSEKGCDGREAALGAIDTVGSQFAGLTAGGAARASASVLVGDRGGAPELTSLMIGLPPSAAAVRQE
ncbi:hypothetical protein RDV64_05125 [Acuticoccus sp. MNP-M23]|uniref:hypothetical protein n=1 Tax=Acuticoccus sp. MNP-M23 TaxID=3072793 RepID=UPI002815CC29|nr:hypothetical protein [Acuticoccus sp. MNP-M23]WMS45168.1 hypothetical protein RDV64_05125 [Acuticoccus sp. MNP-M23]